MPDSTIFNKGDEVSRRQFMIGAARNCLGVSVLPMLGSTLATNETFAAAPPMRRGAAKSVIFLKRFTSEVVPALVSVPALALC